MKGHIRRAHGNRGGKIRCARWTDSAPTSRNRERQPGGVSRTSGPDRWAGRSVTMGARPAEQLPGDRPRHGQRARRARGRTWRVSGMAGARGVIEKTAPNRKASRSIVGSDRDARTGIARRAAGGVPGDIFESTTRTLRCGDGLFLPHQQRTRAPRSPHAFQRSCATVAGSPVHAFDENHAVTSRAPATSSSRSKNPSVCHDAASSARGPMA